MSNDLEYLFGISESVEDFDFKHKTRAELFKKLDEKLQKKYESDSDVDLYEEALAYICSYTDFPERVARMEDPVAFLQNDMVKSFFKNIIKDKKEYLTPTLAEMNSKRREWFFDKLEDIYKEYDGEMANCLAYEALDLATSNEIGISDNKDIFNFINDKKMSTVFDELKFNRDLQLKFEALPEKLKQEFTDVCFNRIFKILDETDRRIALINELTRFKSNRRDIQFYLNKLGKDSPYFIKLKNRENPFSFKTNKDAELFNTLYSGHIKEAGVFLSLNDENRNILSTLPYATALNVLKYCDQNYTFEFLLNQEKYWREKGKSILSQLNPEDYYYFYHNPKFRKDFFNHINLTEASNDAKKADVDAKKQKAEELKNRQKEIDDKLRKSTDEYRTRIAKAHEDEYLKNKENDKATEFNSNIKKIDIINNQIPGFKDTYYDLWEKLEGYQTSDSKTEERIESILNRIDSKKSSEIIDLCTLAKDNHIDWIKLFEPEFTDKQISIARSLSEEYKSFFLHLNDEKREEFEKCYDEQKQFSNKNIKFDRFILRYKELLSNDDVLASRYSRMNIDSKLELEKIVKEHIKNSNLNSELKRYIMLPPFERNEFKYNEFYSQKYTDNRQDSKTKVEDKHDRFDSLANTVAEYNKLDDLINKAVKTFETLSELKQEQEKERFNLIKEYEKNKSSITNNNKLADIFVEDAVQIILKTFNIYEAEYINKCIDSKVPNDLLKALICLLSENEKERALVAKYLDDSNLEKLLSLSNQEMNDKLNNGVESNSSLYLSFTPENKEKHTGDFDKIKQDVISLITSIDKSTLSNTDYIKINDIYKAVQSEYKNAIEKFQQEDVGPKDFKSQCDKYISDINYILNNPSEDDDKYDVEIDNLTKEIQRELKDIDLFDELSDLDITENSDKALAEINKSIDLESESLNKAILPSTIETEGINYIASLNKSLEKVLKDIKKSKEFTQENIDTLKPFVSNLKSFIGTIANRQKYLPSGIDNNTLDDNQLSNKYLDELLTTPEPFNDKNLSKLENKFNSIIKYNNELLSDIKDGMFTDEGLKMFKKLAEIEKVDYVIVEKIITFIDTAISKLNKEYYDIFNDILSKLSDSDASEKDKEIEAAKILKNEVKTRRDYSAILVAIKALKTNKKKIDSLSNDFENNNYELKNSFKAIIKDAKQEYDKERKDIKHKKDKALANIQAAKNNKEETAVRQAIDDYKKLDKEFNKVSLASFMKDTNNTLENSAKQSDESFNKLSSDIIDVLSTLVNTIKNSKKYDDSLLDLSTELKNNFSDLNETLKEKLKKRDNIISSLNHLQTSTDVNEEIIRKINYIENTKETINKLFTKLKDLLTKKKQLAQK